MEQVIFKAGQKVKMKGCGEVFTLWPANAKDLNAGKSIDRMGSATLRSFDLELVDGQVEYPIQNTL